MRVSIQIEFDKILDYETSKTTISIGRSSECDLVIPHQGISRKHCLIENRDNQFFITDLNSSNGVFIEGDKIEPSVRTPIPHKSLLRLGYLDCEVSHEGLSEETQEHSTNKVVTSDATSSIRVARIDINQEVISKRQLNLDLPKAAKGPKNPITATVKKKEKDLTKVYIFVAVLLVVAFYLQWVVRN